jgi:DegV family protein with EDD domain
MARVAIITDSSTCLPSGAIAGRAISIVPVVIHLPSGEVRGDRPDATAQVYEAMGRDEPVKSSAPTPLEYLEAIDAAAAGGADEVVVVTPAAELTVMHRNACVAAELASCPTWIVDSRTAAAAQGLVAMEAAGAAGAGRAADEVRMMAVAASRRAHLVAALDRVDFVRRSGRVPSVALGFAEHLGIKPVFQLRDGEVERLGVPRSERTALRRIVQEAWARGSRSAARSAVFHAACLERAERLRLMLGGADMVTEFSPSMGIHTGPGVVGVAWLSGA